MTQSCNNRAPIGVTVRSMAAQERASRLPSAERAGQLRGLRQGDLVEQQMIGLPEQPPAARRCFRSDLKVSCRYNTSSPGSNDAWQVIGLEAEAGQRYDA